MRNIISKITTLLMLTVLVLAGACKSGTISPLEAKALKNPVPATPKSIASGKNVYDKYCANCHGVTGNGVSEKAQTLAEAGAAKPSDLTDDKWDHGSTDGEIFVNIRDGVGVNGAMKGLDGKPGVSDEDMWNIVNYVRTLARPKQ
jgi:cytochrome c